MLRITKLQEAIKELLYSYCTTLGMLQQTLEPLKDKKNQKKNLAETIDEAKENVMQKYRQAKNIALNIKEEIKNAKPGVTQEKMKNEIETIEILCENLEEKNSKMSALLDSYLQQILKENIND